MKKTIVILLSDKRSGSTMFQEVLCQHPEIQTVAYSPHTYLETHHWLKAAVLLKPNTCKYTGYGSKQNARTYLIDCVKRNVSEFKIPDNDTDLVCEGWNALCNQFAKPVFFEKSPQYLGQPASIDLLLEWIEKTEYTVKVIGLTRNPLSVQYSAWKLFHRDPGDRQYGWADIQRTLLSAEKRLKKDQFLNLRYEDLIAQSTDSFKAICEFIGVSREHSIGGHIHQKSLSKWKEDPYFTVRLDEKVKDVARQFGYTEQELDNPEKPPPPLSYKIKKQIEATYKLRRADLINRVLKPLYLRISSNHTKQEND